jgi:hypothetical protein
MTRLQHRRFLEVFFKRLFCFLKIKLKLNFFPTYSPGLQGELPLSVGLLVTVAKLRAFLIAAAFNGLAINPFGTASTRLTKESIAFSTCPLIVAGVAIEFGKVKSTPRVKVRSPVVGEIVLMF